jgi:murein DD-endopeptidase MepM/ murein hydrolase activator NlpD
MRRKITHAALVGAALLGASYVYGDQFDWRKPHPLPMINVNHHVPRPASAKVVNLSTASGGGEPGLSSSEPGAPLELLRVTSDFGMRLHPILGFVRMHQGVDLGAREGAPVLAAADGVVSDAGPDGGYGNMLRIRHVGGWATGYAHLSAFAPGIMVGTRVTRGELIAFVGHTGLATGPHLHFEVSYNGEKLDPMTTHVGQLGADGSFRWTGLIGQPGAIDLSYRSKSLPRPNAHGMPDRPQVIILVDPIATAVAAAPRPSDAPARMVTVLSSTQPTKAPLAPGLSVTLDSATSLAEGTPEWRHRVAVPDSSLLR